MKRCRLNSTAESSVSPVIEALRENAQFNTGDAFSIRSRRFNSALTRTHSLLSAPPVCNKNKLASSVHVTVSVQHNIGRSLGQTFLSFVRWFDESTPRGKSCTNMSDMCSRPTGLG